MSLRLDTYKNFVKGSNKLEVEELQKIIDEQAVVLFERFIDDKAKILKLTLSGSLEDLENYVSEYNKLFQASSEAKQRIKLRRK